MLHRVKEIVGFLHGRPEVVIYLSTTTRHADFCTNPVNVIPQILLQCAGEEQLSLLSFVAVEGGEDGEDECSAFESRVGKMEPHEPGVGWE